ncbi:CD151 antigen-like isoform X1 [Acyrthosiphon pisum]|uniref:Tetraspanin n=1 Tax=Acyrthosiphon pisum TaxID=7029 RepID=A0A8R1W8Q9_ACYPI|nr:CD151 antigen-like isoform X1 [Acyrthosiphon pisum]|eukprot:XP_003244334.1 PREDICTED: CD151 antigen-like isoform X1 [Acyrthosiphon pisum]
MFISKYLSKFVFQFVNMFCFIFGIGILCIAYFMDRKLYKWSAFVDSELTTVPQLLTTIGLALLVIAVICMCGTLKNIKYQLIMVSVLLAILLIGEYILGSVVYHMCSDMEQYALERMKYTISTYNKTGHEATRQSWNTLQSNIECCGIDGPKDWKLVTRSGELPASCCYAVQIDQSCTEINSYKIGCFEKFKTNLQQNNRIIFWSAVGFALVQIFAVFLAFYCKCSIVHEEYEKI